MKTIALGFACTAALAASAVASAPTATATPSTTSAVTAAAPAASRTVSTTRLIIRAVTAEAVAGGVPASNFRVEKVRVSRANSSWAAAHLVPTGKAKAELDEADAVLHRTKAGWRVSDLGTDGVGCGIAPTKVLKGLGLGC